MLGRKLSLIAKEILFIQTGIVWVWKNTVYPNILLIFVLCSTLIQITEYSHKI